MTAGGIDDGVRAAVVAAEQQTREHGHHAIAPAHLLLGLVVEEAGRGATGDEHATEGAVLASAGLALATVQNAILRRADADLVAVTRLGDHRLRGGWGSPELPVTAQGRGVLQHALRRAVPCDAAGSPLRDRQLVTVAHLLLGLLDHADPVTTATLADVGVDTAALTHHAEGPAATAPLLDAIRPASPDPDRILVHIDDQGRAVFSSFGRPSRLRLDGPAVRRVLARSEQAGEIDAGELHAAAEADAVDRDGPNAP